MEIVININNINYTLNLDKNIILFGKNSTTKNNFLNALINGINGKNKNILINGNIPTTKDYNLLVIDEESDFANEFKFSKNNILKQLIYEDIIEKVNNDKIIKYTNEIFDIIDNKVNKLLDRKVNKKAENNLSFQIEIPDINSIIDKFTNIYIDNILLNSSEISKSMKRKLLYQLYFLDIKNNTDKNNIIIINNFDVYLTTTEIISLLKQIYSISNNNCHFILTSCSNILEYISLDNFNIYKIANNLIPLSYLDKGIKQFLLKREFELLNNNNLNFEKFKLQNEGLILEEEIINLRNKLLTKYPNELGKILNNENIKFISKRPTIINYEYIICDNPEYQKLFRYSSVKR